MIGYSKEQQLSKQSVGKEKACIKCGDKNVVNNTHSLCYDHNQERLNGKDWKEAKIKRSKPLSSKNHTIRPKKKKNSSEATKKLNTYSCSDGSRVTQPQIESKYKSTCKQIDLAREPICESCGRGDKPLSHSHTISRKRAKEIGKAELIWDENNIVLECYDDGGSNSDSCHNLWEYGSIKNKQKSKVFDIKLAVIKEHDKERYNALMMEL